MWFPNKVFIQNIYNEPATWISLPEMNSFGPSDAYMRQ